jgi:hypothetical protein
MTTFPAGVIAGVEHVIAVFLVVVAPWLAARRARRLA